MARLHTCDVMKLFSCVADHKDDHKHLERALELSREIAKDVDEQVQAHERQNLLIETYDKIDTKSATTFKGELLVAVGLNGYSPYSYRFFSLF